MSKKFARIICMCTIWFLLSSCQVNSKNTDSGTNTSIILRHNTTDKEPTKPMDKSASFELTIWNTEYDQGLINSFLQNVYPNAKARLITIDKNPTERLLSALHSGNVPDIVFQQVTNIGEINGLDGFEDFFEPQYNAQRLKERLKFVDEDLWKGGLSFDGKRLIGLPLTTHTAVTFYRADILEENGIPSDPEELGKLLDNYDSFLEISLKLKEKDIWTIQWSDEFVKPIMSGRRFFDEDLNSIINSQQLYDALRVHRASMKFGFTPNISIWNADGQEALRNGKFAMVYLGDWAHEMIKRIDPKEKGEDSNWRVTRMPLNINTEWSAQVMSIPSESKYKTEAYNLASTILLQTIPHHNNELNFTFPYFGNQRLGTLFLKERSKLPAPFFTPLDGKAYDLWSETLSSFYLSSEMPRDFLNRAEKNIMNQLSSDIDLLKQYVEDSN
jgi:multiple sugar transport system substrate-binding protein